MHEHERNEIQDELILLNSVTAELTRSLTVIGKHTGALRRTLDANETYPSTNSRSRGAARRACFDGAMACHTYTQRRKGGRDGR